MTRLESYYEGGEISPRQTDGKTGKMMIYQKTLSHLSHQAAVQKIKYHTPFQLFFADGSTQKKFRDHREGREFQTRDYYTCIQEQMGTGRKGGGFPLLKVKS